MPIKVKLSGDGVPFSNTSSCLFFLKLRMLYPNQVGTSKIAIMQNYIVIVWKHIQLLELQNPMKHLQWAMGLKKVLDV